MITLKDIETLSFGDAAIEELNYIVEQYRSIRSGSYTVYEEKSAKKRAKESFEDFKKYLTYAESKQEEYKEDQAKINKPYTLSEAESIKETIEKVLESPAKLVKIGKRSLEFEVAFEKNQLHLLNQIMIKSDVLIRGCSYRGGILHISK